MPKPTPAIVTLLAVALTVSAGFAALILPKLKELGAAQAALDASHGIVRASSAVHRAEIDKDMRENVQNLIPTEDAQYDLSVQIEALAKKSGVSLSGMQITVIDPKASSKAASGALATTLLSGTKRLSLSLSAAGPYAQLQVFTEGLTRLSRFVTIEQLTVESQKDTSLQITGSAYYIPSAAVK